MNTDERVRLNATDLPAAFLEVGDWRTSGGEPTITARVTRRRPFHGGRRHKAVNAIGETIWAAMKKSSRPVYGRPPEPPNLLRVVAARTDPEGLHLDVQPTWFFYVLCQHWSRRNATPADDNPLDLSTPELANPLTVNVALVTTGREPKVLVQRRGALVTVRNEAYQISAGGFVDAADLHGPYGLPWTTATREMAEETGVNIDRDKIRFLALARSKITLIPGLCAVAMVDTIDESQLGAEEDAFEVDSYELWPFEPEAIMQRVHDLGGWTIFVPLGAAALLAALVDRYSAEAVIAAWVRWR